ncbi:hypothetical protein L1987_16484 [Smallanthus sonchifolius]|uniref:Uncharacterized protein n=1 Tax=Smallanthus sonchifolius TaxID=185202 RepID=A0ACB9J907_9ASTR|nr:hypothetical protein L1987_16484 [Smallanthus sonchifolius]
MGSSYRHEIASTIYVLLMSFFLFSPVFVVKSSENFWQEKETSMSGNGSKKMKLINAHLRKINKPLSSRLSKQDPPKLPKGHDNRIIRSEMKQLWSSNGDSCPNGAIPIRRTSASDMLRSHSISKYGKKLTSAKNNSSGQRHEHALGYLWGREHYGIKAILNVWAPNVTNKDDFSLSQIWVISDIPNHDVNVIEAGPEEWKLVVELG